MLIPKSFSSCTQSFIYSAILKMVFLIFKEIEFILPTTNFPFGISKSNVKNSCLLCEGLLGYLPSGCRSSPDAEAKGWDARWEEKRGLNERYYGNETKAHSFFSPIFWIKTITTTNKQHFPWDSGKQHLLRVTDSGAQSIHEKLLREKGS